MKNKTKTMFAALIAAALVPLTIMGTSSGVSRRGKTSTSAALVPLTIMGTSDATSEDPTMPDKVPDRVIQIQKPAESQAETDDMKTVENILQERTTLADSLETITEQHKNSAVPQDAQDKMDKTNERLAEMETEFAVIQAKSHKLYALSADDEKQLLDAKKIIRDTDIPITGIGPDSKAGALAIGFGSQAIADTHIPRTEQLIDVPYYVEIYDLPVFDACARQTDDCDPPMGGVKITTEYNSLFITPLFLFLVCLKNAD